MQREELPVDVLFVGAGPANLAAAYHLARTLREKGRDDISIAVIEKAQSVGGHTLSGAIMDPVAMNDVYQVGENAQLVIPAQGVLWNDSDAETDVFGLRVAEVDGSAGGVGPGFGRR